MESQGIESGDRSSLKQTDRGRGSAICITVLVCWRGGADFFSRLGKTIQNKGSKQITKLLISNKTKSKKKYQNKLIKLAENFSRTAFPDQKLNSDIIYPMRGGEMIVSLFLG